MLHVWNIYLHLGHFGGKCTKISPYIEHLGYYDFDSYYVLVIPHTHIITTKMIHIINSILYIYICVCVCSILFR